MKNKSTIVHLTSEVAPFYKRGGLGDVAGSLPRYLQSEGTNYVISFHYHGRMKGLERAGRAQLLIPIHGIEYTFHYYRLQQGGVRYYFIDLQDDHVFSDAEGGSNPQQRGKGKTAYRETLPMIVHFYFAKAALYLLLREGIPADFLLLHDWHVGGIFAYEKLLGELRRRHRCKTLLLIHNYEHQGELVPDMFRFMDEESREVLARLYRRYGNASLLGLAIDRSDFVGTVSKGYAEELMTQRAPHPNFHFLQRRSDCVLDFTNGVDYSEWHPRNSPHLPWPYDWESRATKRAYRREVLYQCGLADDERPLALLMARLTPQKGIYLLMNPALEDEAALAQLQRHLRTGWKIIVYGNPSGGTQGRIHHLFSLAQQRFPNRFFYDADYTEPKAHRYLAAADLLLSPSKFEPCGLVQLYAMAFGTVPLVNPIGGLGETVICHQREPKRATGFHLSEYTTDSLHRSLQRAIRLYGLYPDKWEALMRRGMHSDFSWERQIQRYRDFFERYHSRRRLPRELV